MEQLTWKVVQVIPEARDTISYVLEAANGLPVSYEAGQFLTFLFNDHGHDVRRSFSISSAPGLDEQVAITVKRKENGVVSRYILEHWTTGILVQSLPPAGRFILQTDAAAKRQVFFIAAGSGIVPVYALLKKLLHDEPHTEVILMYQNHDEQHIIFHEGLEQLTAKYYPRLTRIDLLSVPILHELPHQRLNNGLLEYIVNRYARQGVDKPLYYTCGPGAFMRMVQFTLRVMGVPDEQIRKENFTVDVVAPPAFTLDAAPRTVSLTLNDRLYRFAVQFPETILTAGLKQQVPMPYSCRGGRCSTCTAYCTSGKVQMSINDVLTDTDLHNGLVLTCVGYAVTDVSITM